MITLTYGLKLPETGDKGSTWFPALEDNITQLDGHTHNGVNSGKVSSSSIQKLFQSILAANWVAVGDGTGRYRQAITLVGSVPFDGTDILLQDASGNKYYLEIEKINASSYYVYTNDNTLALTAYYT
jgi:hypothetical protein